MAEHNIQFSSKIDLSLYLVRSTQLKRLETLKHLKAKDLINNIVKMTIKMEGICKDNEEIIFFEQLINKKKNQFILYICLKMRLGCYFLIKDKIYNAYIVCFFCFSIILFLKKCSYN